MDLPESAHRMAPWGVKYPFGAFLIYLSSRVGANNKKEVTKMHTLLIIGSMILFLFSG